MRKPFLTGSHAYGTPHEDSDVDLVLLVSEETKLFLHEQFGTKTGSWSSVKEGRLNLILVSEEQSFDTWLEGTELLKARKPVTRDEAVELFKSLRERGIEAERAAYAAYRAEQANG